MFKKYISGILFVVFMAYVPLFVFDKLDAKGEGGGSYAGVLNLWHIETFEGGRGSRAEFLKKRAIEFESKNKGVFVSVQTYTLQQVEEKLKQGDNFDLISFSFGVGCKVKELLSPFTGQINVRDDLLAGGVFDGVVLALPWAFGGYTLCCFDDILAKKGGKLSLQNAFGFGYTKKDKNKTKVPSLAVGFAQYTNPMQLLADCGAKGVADEWQNDLSVTPYQAYQSFVQRDYALLLGTQRDLSRVLVKQSQGKMTDVTFEFLGGYTDLVQYIGFCDNKDRGALSQAFAQYLTSDHSQKKLAGIGMFSPSLDIYSDGLQDKMEKALSSDLKVPCVFDDEQKLQQAKQKAMEIVGI